MFRFFCFAALAVIAPLSAMAGVIYSTDGTSAPGYFPVNGYSSSSTVFHGMQFQVAAGSGGVFDQLVTAAYTDRSFTATFNLRADSGDNRGAILDTVTIDLIGDSTAHEYVASSQNHVTLTAGSKYWLDAATTSSSANTYVWLQANPGPLSRVYSSQTGYFNQQPVTAFAILENPPAAVPEPGSGALLLASLAVLAVTVKNNTKSLLIR